MLLLILPAIWLILIGWGVQFNKNGNEGGPLSKEMSLALRGICAIEIILGHFSIYSGSEILYLLRKADILFVGLFFLMSGYGTALSFREKEGYSRFFIIRKMLYLFVPAYIAFGFNKWHLNILYPNITHIREFLSPEYFVKDVNWFIYELMGMYVMSYIAYRIDRLKKTGIILWIGSVLFLVAAVCLNLDSVWYGCTLCYPLGFTYYLYRQRFNEVIRNNSIVKLIVAAVLFFAFSGAYIMLDGRNPLLEMILKNLASLLFCVLGLIVLTYVKIGNKVSKWLGKISFELYLFHVPVIGLAVHFIPNIFLCGLVSLICSVIVAAIMRFVLSKFFR